MQGTFACFLFLPSFAVESFARNVQNGFTLSFGRERFISFSAWLFAYYEFQSIALRQRSSLYAHNPLCFANKEKEMNNKKINGAFYEAQRHVDVPLALSHTAAIISKENHIIKFRA